MTAEDRNLLDIYMDGFNDELSGTTSSCSCILGLEYRAYKLGALHAELGDDITSIDELLNEEILEQIKK